MGSKVKKVVKSVVKPIKKIVSSPVGQLGLAVFAPQFSFLKGTGFINQALNRALVNAAATKLSGGDVDLKSALVAGGIGAAVPNIPGISKIPSEALQRAAVGSLTNIGTNLATGRDVNLQQAALAGGLSAGVGALQDRLSPPSVIPGQEGFDTTDYLDGNKTMQSAEQLSGIDEFAEGQFIPASTPRTDEVAQIGRQNIDQRGSGRGIFSSSAIASEPGSGDTVSKTNQFINPELDLAETAAEQTVRRLGTDLVGPGGVPLAQPTVRTTLADIGRSLMDRDISGAASGLADYVTDKRNAPKILLGALTAAPLFFSPEQQEDETAAEFAQRRSDVTKFLRQYGSNFYSGAELDDFLSRTTSNLGYASGGQVDMPTGIMKTNAAGIKERDYRETGGFVPVGIKEKADDVPAMLSKNEFVMTADAVRGAGNGSIEKGAQKMYDTMKELENRVA